MCQTAATEKWTAARTHTKWGKAASRAQANRHAAGGVKGTEQEWRTASEQEKILLVIRYDFDPLLFLWFVVLCVCVWGSLRVRLYVCVFVCGYVADRCLCLYSVDFVFRARWLSLGTRIMIAMYMCVCGSRCSVQIALAINCHSMFVSHEAQSKPQPNENAYPRNSQALGNQRLKAANGIVCDAGVLFCLRQPKCLLCGIQGEEEKQRKMRIHSGKYTLFRLYGIVLYWLKCDHYGYMRKLICCCYGGQIVLFVGSVPKNFRKNKRIARAQTIACARTQKFISGCPRLLEPPPNHFHFSLSRFYLLPAWAKSIFCANYPKIWSEQNCLQLHATSAFCCSLAITYCY